MNKVLQRENDRLKEEIIELREDDMNWHVRWWRLWESNALLWELVEGMECKLEWHSLRANTRPTPTFIKVYSYSTKNGRIKERT